MSSSAIAQRVADLEFPPEQIDAAVTGVTEQGWALVRLTPGDMTQYPILIVRGGSEGWLLGYVGYGLAELPHLSGWHHEYLGEKIGIQHMGEHAHRVVHRFVDLVGGLVEDGEER